MGRTKPTRQPKRQRQPKRWRKLDNAAKLFPPTSSRRNPRVFRFACELHEPVNPAALQDALDKTIELFPVYRSVMKRGLFWYYLEESDLETTVAHEDNRPCAPLYMGNRKNLLFSVTYHLCRINLEVYHVLSDGTGAIQFLRTLITFYLQEKHGLPFDSDGLPDYNAAHTERNNDSFQQYFSKELQAERKELPRSYKIRGDRLPPGQMNIVEGLMSVAAVKAAAKARETTVTEFLTAVLIMAIGEGVELSRRNRPVTISVPVNLRQYFISNSARNFFSVVNISCYLEEKIVFEDILRQVRDAFAAEITEEKIRKRMNAFASLEHNFAMKLLPLALKDPIMGAVARHADKRVTAALSNVGIIKLPEEAAEHIRLIDSFTSTKGLHILLVSYRDSFIVNFASVFEDNDIQRRFFRHMTGLGIDCEVSSNWTDVKE